MLLDATSGHTPKEILALAEHQLGILKRRFPNYEHVLYKHGICWISVSDKGGSIILAISFYSSSIEIISSFGDEETITIEEDFVLDYADPRFTDDTISDKLKEWEET